MIVSYIIIGLCLHSSSTVFSISGLKTGWDTSVSKEAVIKGDVTIGTFTIVKSGVHIIAEAGPIVIGEDNVIEKDVQILNILRGNNNSGNVMTIGSNNNFRTGAYIEAKKIGSDNVFGSNCKVGRNIEITSDCKILARCEMESIPANPEDGTQKRQHVLIKSDAVIGGKCEFQGDVTIGEDAVIKSGVRIVAEAGPVNIRSDVVIHKNVTFLNSRQGNNKGIQTMNIGSDNTFGDNALIEAQSIGSGNNFRSNCKIGRNIVIKSDCEIQKGCEMTSTPNTEQSAENNQKVLIESDTIVGGKCEFQGDITIGMVSDIKDGVQITAEAGPIILGAATVIEKNVQFLNLNQGNASGTQTMNIGNANYFEDGAYIEAQKMGDYNRLKSRCKIGKYTELENWCSVGEGCEITSKEVIPDLTVFSGANCERTIKAKEPFQYPTAIHSIIEHKDMIFLNRQLIPVRGTAVSINNNVIYVDGNRLN